MIHSILMLSLDTLWVLATFGLFPSTAIVGWKAKYESSCKLGCLAGFIFIVAILNAATILTVLAGARV